LLDQFSSIYGKTNTLVFTDFRTLDYANVPLGDEACFLICNTKVHHNLVGSEYNVRRESCERAVKFFAQKLQHPVTHLRDVSWAEWKEFSGQMDPIDAKRSAHPIGEDERVLQGNWFLSISHVHSERAFVSLGQRVCITSIWKANVRVTR
jgi:galactokinase